LLNAELDDNGSWCFNNGTVCFSGTPDDTDWEILKLFGKMY
jgi:hypothetical protein